MNLSLETDSTTMTANWSIITKYEKFNVTIKTNSVLDYEPDTKITTNLSHIFTGLKPGVLYTVSVVTINGNLTSPAATRSDYTSE